MTFVGCKERKEIKMKGGIEERREKRKESSKEGLGEPSNKRSNLYITVEKLKVALEMRIVTRSIFISEPWAFDIIYTFVK